VAASRPGPVPGDRNRAEGSAGGARGKPTETAARTAAPAVSPQRKCLGQLDPVAIGQVGTFSGFLGPIIGPARTALAAWAMDVNAHGGLACHPVVVYSADDGGDPAPAP